VEALARVCERVVVVCRQQTDIGALDVERWDEPEGPQHPIAGIVHALERAEEPVLVCAADMPFVTADALRRIQTGLEPGANAAVAMCESRLEPLLAAYAPGALHLLRGAPPGDPLRRTVESLAPVAVELPPEVVFNVNTADDLAEAERRLST
jgi:molybdopterin-guanine dinucleotide biosynthesis protein A